MSFTCQSNRSESGPLTPQLAANSQSLHTSDRTFCWRVPAVRPGSSALIAREKRLLASWLLIEQLPIHVDGGRADEDDEDAREDEEHQREDHLHRTLLGSLFGHLAAFDAHTV